MSRLFTGFSFDKLGVRAFYNPTVFLAAAKRTRERHWWLRHHITEITHRGLALLKDTIESTDDCTDAELAQRIATGNAAALELLMRRNNQLLYRAARSILKNEEEAEETVQDAYLKAYRTITEYRGDAKLSTWLTRILINEALARRRKQQRRAELIFLNNTVASPSESEENYQMQHDFAVSPEGSVQRAEARRMIERNIDKLPEAFRCVFVLRALEEMTVEETASCLDLPKATVRSRFFRARGQLREAMAREIDISIDEAFSFAGERCDRIVATVLARLEFEPVS